MAWEKIINVLNYKQKEYGGTADYLKIMRDPEGFLEKYMKGLALDDQCARLLQVDNLIDSLTQLEKCSKEEQRTNHVDAIYHMKGVFLGELAAAERYRDYILEDLKRLEQDLETIRGMQESSELVV